MRSEPESHAVEGCIAILAESPQQFEAALSHLGEAEFGRRPAPDDWSPLEVLRHVRASDLIVASRIWNWLIRPDGVHLGLDERTYGDLLARAGLSAADQVRAFTLRRRELVGLLLGLSNHEWTSSVQTDFGEVSMLRLAGDMASHEQEHLGQLARAVATNETASRD
ncbi:MAG: DinB family protein [Candidatus Dormiibacterota bacterium]